MFKGIKKKLTNPLASGNSGRSSPTGSGDPNKKKNSGHSPKASSKLNNLKTDEKEKDKKTKGSKEKEKDMSSNDLKNKTKSKSKHKRIGIFSTNNTSASNTFDATSNSTNSDNANDSNVADMEVVNSSSDEMSDGNKNGISSGSENKHKKPKHIGASSPESSPTLTVKVNTSSPNTTFGVSQSASNASPNPMPCPSPKTPRSSRFGEISKEVLIQSPTEVSPYAGQHLQQASMGAILAQYKGLPVLGDAAAEDIADLFRSKLELCKILFDFDKLDETGGGLQGSQGINAGPAATNGTELLYGKELKRKTLLELVEYVNTDRGQKVFALDRMMEDVIDMVSVNIFRALPPQEDEYDPEEDDPVLESAWPHLQVVYEFLLRFVVSKEVSSKVAKRKGVIDQKFCLRIIHLFDSEDPRERDYLKTILHRVYGKFMNHRQYIRTQIGYSFQRFVYKTKRHNGISELLEILGSIINGFVLPLKEEHQVFLRTCLIPLHKPKMVSQYHALLSYCIVQYTEKDKSTCVPIMNGLFKYWPWTHSSKQVMFLNEVEDILDTVVPDFVEEMRPALLRILSRSIESEHFQVVERTLYLWNNNQIVNHCFTHDQAKYVLPAIFSPLKEKLNQHWNPTVMHLSDQVAHLYRIVDSPLWQQLESTHKMRNEMKLKTAQRRKEIWSKLKAGTPPSKIDFEGNLTSKDPSTDGDYTDDDAYGVSDTTMDHFSQSQGNFMNVP